jgi:hypothetical protein
MSQQQQQLLLTQEWTISQILRSYGKQFRQITERYSDGKNGRCAIGVIMSYYRWKGKDDSQATKIKLSALIGLRHSEIDIGLIIGLNDSGFTFDLAIVGSGTATLNA